MRRELVDLIVPTKAIAYFQASQGWSAGQVRLQVLTPIEESSLLGTAHADRNSIMCYQIPGTITKTDRPIIGGVDIDRSDSAFAAKIYPNSLKAPSRPHGITSPAAGEVPIGDLSRSRAETLTMLSMIGRM